MSTTTPFKIPAASLWERRMQPKDGKVKEIAHYFPVIGRGNVSHDTIPHAIVEKELRGAFTRSFSEWCRKLMDWQGMSEQAIEHLKPQERYLSIIDVRRFYWNDFIVIYDILNANLKQLPSELHFEIAAAFDHLMRTDILDPSDAGYQESMEKSVGHLKRATFDGFKLLFKYPIRQRWLQLTHPRYNDVDNGQFVPQVESLWKEAREIVSAARAKERLSRRDDPIVWNAAFAEWKKLLPILRKLDELAESEGAKRARRKYIRSVCGAVCLFLLGFVATKGLEWIYAWAEKWFEK